MDTLWLVNVVCDVTPSAPRSCTVHMLNLNKSDLYYRQAPILQFYFLPATKLHSETIKCKIKATSPLILMQQSDINCPISRIWHWFPEYFRYLLKRVWNHFNVWAYLTCVKRCWDADKFETSALCCAFPSGILSVTDGSFLDLCQSKVNIWLTLWMFSVCGTNYYGAEWDFVLNPRYNYVSHIGW